MFSTKWKEILDEVDEFSRNSDGAIWFRGHSCTSYLLKSGLFRLNLPSINEYIFLENQFYRYFKNLGYLLHGDESGWNLLYSMQHHSVKTRLLDWTESFSVALYFATASWGKGCCRIWLLNPKGLNLLSINKQEIVSPTIISYPNSYDDEDKNSASIAIYPIKNNNRINSQAGVFTVQGNTINPLNEEFDGDLLTKNYLKSIDLPIDVREDALRYLDINGINRFSLFPDLDGLAIFLEKRLIEPSWI